MPDVRLIDANAYEYPGDLIHMPTIDAVPVVRCRECRLWRRVGKYTGKCPFLIGENQFTADDHYCSLAEKMDGGASNGSDS